MHIHLCLREPIEHLRPAEGVKSLVRVPDERKTHLRGHILACLGGLGPKSGAVVVLINLIDGEVLSVDVGLQFGLEWCTNTSESIPLHATEEGVLFDLVGATNSAKAVLSIANEA